MRSDLLSLVIVAASIWAALDEVGGAVGTVGWVILAAYWLMLFVWSMVLRYRAQARRRATAAGPSAK